MRECPYCKSVDIKYSVTTSGRHYRVYRASYYCNNCHAYGPRVLSEKIKSNDYTKIKEIKASKTLEEQARKKWDDRNE